MANGSSSLISMLAKASKTEAHELLLDCMDYFHVGSTRELSEEQLMMYIFKLRSEGRII